MEQLPQLIILYALSKDRRTVIITDISQDVQYHNYIP